MRVLSKYYFCFILLFCGIQTEACSLFENSYYTLSCSYPRVIDLDCELSHSKFIGLVIVNNYDSAGNIKFSSIEFKDTVKKAYVDANFPYRKLYSNPKLFLTASLPSKGDTVLIVLDLVGKVSLFAKQIGNNYRFWSPYVTGSAALFSFSPPATAIDKKNETESSSKDYNQGWDGCLLPKNYLLLYIKNSHTHSHCNG